MTSDKEQATTALKKANELWEKGEYKLAADSANQFSFFAISVHMNKENILLRVVK